MSSDDGGEPHQYQPVSGVLVCEGCVKGACMGCVRGCVWDVFGYLSGSYAKH